MSMSPVILGKNLDTYLRFTGHLPKNISNHVQMQIIPIASLGCTSKQHSNDVQDFGPKEKLVREGLQDEPPLSPVSRCLIS